jgi:hypothetical protein
MDEDMERIAKEFGDTPPNVKTAKDSVPEQPKEEKPDEEQKTIPEPKEKPINVKIQNSFFLGMLSALGFWLMTIILAGIAYLAFRLII